VLRPLQLSVSGDLRAILDTVLNVGAAYEHGFDRVQCDGMLHASGRNHVDMGQ